MVRSIDQQSFDRSMTVYHTLPKKSKEEQNKTNLRWKQIKQIWAKQICAKQSLHRKFNRDKNVMLETSP